MTARASARSGRCSGLARPSSLTAAWRRLQVRCSMPSRPGEPGAGAAARRARADRISSAWTSWAATSWRACSPARGFRSSLASRWCRFRRSSARCSGAVAGYFGGVVDDLVSRIVDVLLAFPGLLLAIALVAVLGPSLGNVLFALTIIGWVGYARLVRGQVLRAREFEYVQAARALGAGRTPRAAGAIIIPTALPAVVVQATLGMAGAIISEAALSFLGLGVQPPTPSWGTMLNGGRAHLLDAPHLTLFPGLAIALSRARVQLSSATA